MVAVLGPFEALPCYIHTYCQLLMKGTDAENCMVFEEGKHAYFNVLH
jgi:hypothetical protein